MNVKIEIMENITNKSQSEQNNSVSMITLAFRNSNMTTSVGYVIPC